MFSIFIERLSKVDNQEEGKMGERERFGISVGLWEAAHEGSCHVCLVQCWELGTSSAWKVPDAKETLELTC